MPFLLPDARLDAMLREDAPYGDMTTLALSIGDRPGRAMLRAGRPMTVCCAEEAERLFLLAGCTAVRRFATSGCQLEQGSEILVAEGPACALHLAHRTAQVLMEATSGVATRARRILLSARQGRHNIAVACTRKHIPGTKDAMLKAVLAAGCTAHRYGQSESILVFAQHRAFLGRVPPREWIARLRAAQPERRLVIEAESVDEAVLFANSGADCVQLDRMAPEQVAEAVRAIAALGRKVLIAATGGIHEGNATAYAMAGADVLVTSAPYAAPPLDVKVVMADAHAAPQQGTQLGRSLLATNCLAGPRP
ncbi:ModD protein [Paracraurococcus lichenis]|uniref:Putative pyrophosphorylase ModD n=1 Tax=Paracraurococcus lichenis TaxID=3064888 RepID=A0ABT9EAD5_9PROT|nr:ModD protein [Paracraurococcus sp. LOR1-02]MDO9713054.1 ModD protein [Paracraurococcus sp. LOR1-02]